jgi:hypothetical protein
MGKILLILQKKGKQVLKALLPQPKPIRFYRPNAYDRRPLFCASDAPQVGQYGLDVTSIGLYGENWRKSRRLSPFLSYRAYTSFRIFQRFPFINSNLTQREVIHA